MSTDYTTKASPAAGGSLARKETCCLMSTAGGSVRTETCSTLMANATMVARTMDLITESIIPNSPLANSIRCLSHLMYLLCMAAAAFCESVVLYVVCRLDDSHRLICVFNYHSADHSSHFEHSKMSI